MILIFDSSWCEHVLTAFSQLFFWFGFDSGFWVRCGYLDITFWWWSRWCLIFLLQAVFLLKTFGHVGLCSASPWAQLTLSQQKWSADSLSCCKWMRWNFSSLWVFPTKNVPAHTTWLPFKLNSTEPHWYQGWRKHWDDSCHLFAVG